MAEHTHEHEHTEHEHMDEHEEACSCGHCHDEHAEHEHEHVEHAHEHAEHAHEYAEHEHVQEHESEEACSCGHCYDEVEHHHEHAEHEHEHGHEAGDCGCGCGCHDEAEHDHDHGHDHGHEHGHEHHHHDHAHTAAELEEEAALIAVMERDLESAPTFTYHVLDIDCPHCAMTCQNAVKGLDCVEDARLIYTTATLQVLMREGEDEANTKRQVLETVRSCGQDLELTEAEKDEMEAHRTWFEENRSLVLMGTSGVFLLLGLIAEHIAHNEMLARVCFVISALAGVVFIAPMALASAKRRTADMNVLMFIAVVGALLMGAFEEAAMVIFLDQVGEWLEGWSMRKTSGSIKELMDLTPAVAHVVGAGGSVRDVPVASVEEGQTIRILAGERVPLDGVIISGASSFDEAPVTGESVPQDKAAGDAVFGGTLNTYGVVEVEVTADEDCSTLARIISMVQGAQAQKAPYEAFIDRFAERYTPIVIGIAAAVAFVVPLVLGMVNGMETIVWRDWIYRALSLLVVACPCALVLSTPVSFVSGITRAAKLGMLVKGGAYFDIGSKVDTVLFDKTGTLTTGKPQVTELVPLAGADADAVVAVASALEANSTHPIARAIVAHAQKQGIAPFEVDEVTELAGKGMTGKVQGADCAIGKIDFAREFARIPEDVEERVKDLSRNGATALVLVAAGVVVAVIAVADTIRESSADALEEMRELGISNLEMLTGDNRYTADAIASQVAVTRVSAELMPDDKLARVSALNSQGATTCMVGDGINDAPALATADLGVTMGAAASDTALEVADVAVLSDDFGKLPEFFRLARRTMNVVRENVAIAIGVKLLVMILVIAGIAGMGAAVFADTGVAVIVILNGMRLMLDWDTDF